MCWHGTGKGTMIDFSLPNGEHRIDIEGYAAHVIYSLEQIFGCATQSVKAGVNTSDIVKGTMIKA